MLPEALDDFGVLEETTRYAKSDIDGRTKLELLFSHDVCNHGVFSDCRGRTLPVGSLPMVVRIECDQGAAEWRHRRSR